MVRIARSHVVPKKPEALKLTSVTSDGRRGIKFRFASGYTATLVTSGYINKWRKQTRDAMFAFLSKSLRPSRAGKMALVRRRTNGKAKTVKADKSVAA